MFPYYLLVSYDYGFDFAALFAWVSYATALFYDSAIMKLWINNLLFPRLYTWPFIKSCGITKEFMVCKIQRDVVFSISEEISFRKGKYIITTILLIPSIPKHASKTPQTKLKIFLSSKFSLWNTLEWRRNLDRITVKKILKCFRTNGCRKWRNRF